MFNGFPKETLPFLAELADNNDRDWFRENKPRYEASVLEPAMEFVEAMSGPLRKVSKHFSAVAKRSGGSIMRVYRDTRFSKNKTPFKTNLGIQFRHEFGKDVHAPGFYFHIAPGRIFAGAGIWGPKNPVLNKIRFLIDDRPDRWKRVTRAKVFRETFELQGGTLIRNPRDYESDHPLIVDLKRKDHIGICSLEPSEISSPDLVENLIARYRIATPYVRFLCDSLYLPC